MKKASPVVFSFRPRSSTLPAATSNQRWTRKRLVLGFSLALLVSIIGHHLTAEEPEAILKAIPSKAAVVVLVDLRASNPSMGVLRSGQRAHTWELFEAWGLAAGHALLTQVDKQLRIKEDLLEWLDGRFAVALLAPQKGATEPEVLFMALVNDESQSKENLQRILESASQKFGTKLFTKGFQGCQLTHVIDQEKGIDLSFTVHQQVLVATDKMDNLRRWLEGSNQDSGFAATTVCRELDRYREGIVRFYAKPSEAMSFQGAMPPLPNLPLPGMKAPAGESTPQDSPSKSSLGPSAREIPSPLKMVDCVVGSVTYMDTGALARVSAIMSADNPKDAERLKQLVQIHSLHEDTLGFCPKSPLLVVALPDVNAWLQVGGDEANDLVRDVFGFEGENEEKETPVWLKQVLAGDIAICIPELQGKSQGKGGTTSISDINPLDLISFVVALRAPDDCDLAKVIPEMRAHFTKTGKGRVEDKDNLITIYPPPQEGEKVEAKPIAYCRVARHHLLISPNKEQVQLAAQRVEANSQSLASNPYFREVAAAAFANSKLQVYFDPVQFLASGGEVALSAADMPNPYVREAMELTFEGLRGIGAGSRISDNVIETTYCVGADWEKLSQLGSMYNLVVPSVLAAAAIPIFQRPREKALTSICQSNIKQLGLAAAMYRNDHNGISPDANRWREQLSPYYKNEAILHCPGDKSRNTNSYAMNTNLSLAKESIVTNPSEVILFFDAIGKSASPHGAGSIVSKRHSGGANACFLDGHVKWLRNIPTTFWEVKPKPQPVVAPKPKASASSMRRQ